MESGEGECIFTVSNNNQKNVQMAKKVTTPEPVKPIKKSKKMPIEEFMAREADKLEEMAEGEGEGEGPGKIVQILRLYTAGYSPKEIIKAGFNKSTVYRQTGELKKLKAAPALKMHGFELYEARVQRLMSRKNLSRDQAVEEIALKDLEG